MNDEYGLAGILPEAEAAGFRDFVDVACEQPGLAPDVLFLEFEEAGIGIAAAGKVGQGGKTVRRCRSRRFVFHEVAQGIDCLAVHGLLFPLRSRIQLV